MKYDAQTGKTFPHSHTLPYYIDIDADYLEDDIATPIYDKLKRDATKGDAESMRMFDLMLGYLMIPNRSGKCYFVMAHAKDSGKSVFGHFIESIYCGGRVKTVNLEHLAGRFSLSNADSMLLLSGLETGTNRLDEATAAQIKRITGETTIRIETKYKSETNAKIRFKLLLATNKGIFLPRGIKDMAFYRRTIIIPFLQSIPMNKLLADMPEKLQGEKSAILSKAARMLREIIRSDGGIVFPESTLSKTIKQTWSGSFGIEQLFMSKRLHYTGNPADALPKDDIYSQYLSFCENVISHNKIRVDMCSKDELMRKIMDTYPGSMPRKLRRASLNHPTDRTLRPCMTGLQWKRNAT